MKRLSRCRIDKPQAQRGVMKAKLTDEASKSALAKLSGWSDVAGNDVASRVIRITMPKNRNEAAKQLRAGLEPCFKLRLIIPIETPGVIDDFAQPPAHVAALVDGVTRLCPFSCSYCCGCWCTPQEKSLTLVHW
jgi:hypothetical protein